MVDVAEYEPRIRRVLQSHEIEDEGLAHFIWLNLFVAEDLFGRMPKMERARLRKIASDLDKLQEQMNSVSWEGVTWPYGGLFDDTTDAMQRLGTAIANAVKTRPGNATSERGKQRLSVYRELCKAGIDDAWRCSRIIADILVAVDLDEPPISALQATIYQQLRNLNN